MMAQEVLDKMFNDATMYSRFTSRMRNAYHQGANETWQNILEYRKLLGEPMLEKTELTDAEKKLEEIKKELHKNLTQYKEWGPISKVETYEFLINKFFPEPTEISATLIEALQALEDGLKVRTPDDRTIFMDDDGSFREGEETLKGGLTIVNKRTSRKFTQDWTILK